MAGGVSILEKVALVFSSLKGNEIYGHLFENPRTGLERNIYWNLSARTGWLPFTGRLIGVEWLTFNVRSWTELNAADPADVLRPDRVEASAYIDGQHWSLDLDQLTLKRVGRSADFRIRLRGHVASDQPGPLPRFKFKIERKIRFTGIVVVPESLGLDPSSPEEASAAVSVFIQISNLTNPSPRGGFSYVLRPLTGGDKVK
ncbi:MAG: hypothetical protein V4707_00405 [Pseudomonadota bacterium]